MYPDLDIEEGGVPKLSSRRNIVPDSGELTIFRKCKESSTISSNKLIVSEDVSILPETSNDRIES